MKRHVYSEQINLETKALDHSVSCRIPTKERYHFNEKGYPIFKPMSDFRIWVEGLSFLSFAEAKSAYEGKGLHGRRWTQMRLDGLPDAKRTEELKFRSTVLAVLDELEGEFLDIMYLPVFYIRRSDDYTLSDVIDYPFNQTERDAAEAKLTKMLSTVQRLSPTGRISKRYNPMEPGSDWFPGRVFAAPSFFRDGVAFMTADYSEIEKRILAHPSFSGETVYDSSRYLPDNNWP